MNNTPEPDSVVLNSELSGNRHRIERRICAVEVHISAKVLRDGVLLDEEVHPGWCACGAPLTEEDDALCICCVTERAPAGVLEPGEKK